MGFGLSPDLMAEASYRGGEHFTSALAGATAAAVQKTSATTQAVANSRAVHFSMQAYETYGDGVHAVNQARKIWQNGATVSQEVQELFWSDKPQIDRIPRADAVTTTAKVMSVVNRVLPFVSIIFAAVSAYTIYSELSLASEAETDIQRLRHRFAAIGALGSIGINVGHAIKGFYAVQWAGEKALRVVPGLTVVSAIFATFSIMSRATHLRDLHKQYKNLEHAELENQLEGRKIRHAITQERLKCAIDALSIVASVLILVTPVGPVVIATVIIAAATLQLIAIGHNRWCAPTEKEEAEARAASTRTHGPGEWRQPSNAALFVEDHD